MRFDWNTDTGLVRMYGIIGEYYDEISATDFMDCLDDMGGQDILIHLKSPGGEIDDGLSIYNQIKAYTGKVTVEVDVQAASIATVFPMAADQVLMRPRSEMFIHDPWTIAMGNSTDFRGIAEWLDGLAMSIAGVYEEKTGRDASEWFDMMRETKTFSSELAVEYGLADGIVGMPKAEDSAVREPARAQEKAVPMASIRIPCLVNSLDKRMRIRKINR